jgi:hypothetical protein
MSHELRTGARFAAGIGGAPTDQGLFEGFCVRLGIVVSFR